jgi:hypothetical protein
MTPRLMRQLAAVAFVMAAAACTRPPTAPTPNPRPDVTPPRPPTGTQLQAVGCFLQGASAAAGNLTTLASSGQIYFPSGNAVIDGFLQTEGLNLVGTFSLSPRMFLLVDNQSPNAYATPERANALGPDGTILFGHRMLSEQLQRDPSGATAVAIMAHEFGHLAQFRTGFREPGKRPELHADYMAGWYMNLRGRYAWTNLMPALQVFFSVGDYQFNSPTHHGTPQERLSAAQAGFASGALNAGHAYQLGLQFVSRF